VDCLASRRDDQQEVARPGRSRSTDLLENYLNMATALSGTGPMYVFILEAMVDAGVHLGCAGWRSSSSRRLCGSVDYYTLGPAGTSGDLRNQVTPPGGLLQQLFTTWKKLFRTAISRAVWAAYERSVGR
jgi:pyrroline-5-carboxylate reductase